MPELSFTPYQEQVWLQRNNYDPENYYIDKATGNVLLKHKVQPSFTPETSQQIPVNKPTTEDTTAPSVLGSFGRGAVSGVLPSAGSIITGGRVASALTPLATELAPSTRGLSLAIPPIAGIASGLLSSFGLNKLQENLLPESIKQKLAQDVAANPKAFLAGQVTSALPLLKPSFSNLGRAAGTTGQIAENVITGGARPVAASDISNLINVGLGAGVGLGSSTIPNLIQGREINPLEVALATGGGALFSEPTKIGQKLAKLTPTEPRINQRKELERIQTEEGESLQERANRQLQAQVKAKFLEEEPKGLRAQLIKAEQTTSPEALAAKKFDIAETDVRPRTFYSESKVNEKGETKYLIPFSKISKEDKLLFPSLVNEKGSLRAGVDEAMFREKLDERLYGSEFQQYKDLLEEAKINKQQVDIREQQERTQEAAQREQKVLQNITQASLEERAKPNIIKPVEPLKPTKETTTEYGERKFTTEQLARKPVTTLRQKAYNKEANYQYWKQLWKKASLEGDEQARKDADRFLEEGFAERFTKEEIEGKPQPKFSEVENLPSKLLKKPTVFEEGEQGLSLEDQKTLGVKSFEEIEDIINKQKTELKVLTDKAKAYVKVGALYKAEELESKISHVRGGLLKNENILSYYKTKYGRKFQEVEEGEQGIVQGENKQERLESVKVLEKEVPKEKLSLKAATFDYFKENFGPLRNIEIKEDGSLIHPITKQPVKGEAVLREGIQKATAKLNPNTATLDTLGHEPFHIFVKDLETSPHKIDRDIANGFYKAVENSSEFTKINDSRINRGLKPFDANEIGTEEFGIEFARRILNPNKMEDTLKQAWRDLLSRIRIRWGKANVNDYTRLLTERFFRDPDYIERFTGKGITPKPELQQEQKPKEEIYEPTNKPTEQRENNAEAESKISRLPTGEEQIQPKERIIEPGQEQKNKMIKFYSEEEQGLKSKPSPEKVTEGIKDKLGEASIKAASETVRQQGVEKQSAIEINKNYEILANDLGEQLKKVNPKIKNLDVEFLKDEISSIANNNKDVENAYRRRLGDEYIDELKDRIDKELRPSFGKYQEEVRTTQEKGKKALLKAEELEAFEREDVSRHQEEEQGLKKAEDNYQNNLKLSEGTKEGLVLIRDREKPFDDAIFISKSAIDNNIWRATLFTREDGQNYSPAGHVEYFSFEDALKAASGVKIKNKSLLGSYAFKVDKNTKFSEESQGLRTPKEILDKIKSIRTAPEFQKENVFKKGIKEVISSRIPIFGSDIDKLEVRGGESGKLIAPALREYFTKNREFEGKYLNPIVEQLNKLNNDELDNLYATMLSERKQQISLKDTLPKKQQEVYDVLRKVLKQKQEDQIKAEQPVQEITKEGKINYRLPRIDPFYVPEIVGSKQLDILLNAQGSQAFDNLRKDFISFQKKSYNLNDKAAASMFDDLIASYGGPVKGDTTHFGAVRRSEGVGLPESWLESDLTLAMRRYWRRVAKDRAFYDTIENNDNLLHIIGHKRNAWGQSIKPDEDLISLSGNETLGNIMDIIQGRFIKTNPRLDAFGRIASNLVLGPITGITDLINAAPILAKFIPSVSNIPGFLKSSLNLVEGIKAAKRQGIIKENITSIGDIMAPSDEFVEGLRKAADTVSKVNTREYLEKASRGLSQALSDYLIGVHLNLAKIGNKKSINLLEGLANQKDYAKLSKEQLASRLVELGQGTYDPRGLPSWAIDSQIAPFFRLAKWNIEQLNNLHKHVIIPASKGDLTPLLMTLGGGVIGGYLAKEVREKLNQKKQAIPEWKEIFASKEGLKGNIPDATYNLAAAISYSGITGLLGDLTKAGFDVAFKNTPQGFNYPLVELIGDGAVKINQAADAIAEGENPINVTTKLLEDIAGNHIQMGRIINNQIQSKTNKEQFSDIESRRNLRTYKMVSNEPYPAQGIQNEFENPYLNLETKSFKKRGLSELKEASKEGLELTKKALQEKDTSKITKKLSSLKRNTFQTIPSPTNDPIGFSNFIKYNTEVRGEADTKQRLQRYFQQNLANQVKASFIP